MDPKARPSRLRGVSAHAIALVALFVALSSGAYAALSINSVGPKQIQANAVGEKEIDKAAVDTEELKRQAVTEAKLAQESVGQAQLQEESVGLAQMSLQTRLDTVSQSMSILSNVISAQNMQANSILTQMIDNGAVHPEDLSPEASMTLYTDNNDTGQTITTDTQIGALSLPAGTYLVLAGVEAVHTGAGVPTRLECYIVNGPEIVDFAKERLEPNVAADSLIFTKQMLQGPATLASTGTLGYRCATADSGGSPIALDHIHFSALRVGSIVAQ